MIGVQMFGVCAGSKAPLEETLQQIKSIGYDAVEPCLALEPIPEWKHAIWPEENFRSAAKQIRQLGMSIPSCHVFASDLRSHCETMISLSREYGIHYYVVKTPEPMTKEGLAKTAECYTEVGKSLSDAGITLLLHNEQADGMANVDGVSAYEHLLTTCDGALAAEVDVGWLHAAGIPPLSFIEHHPEWVKVLHYKDFSRAESDWVEQRVGTGEIPLAECVRFAETHNLPQIVDQDHYREDLFAELKEVYQRISVFRI